MFSRRFAMIFAIGSVVILGTGYFTTRYFAQDLQTHLQTETNRLAYSRVLLSTRLLGEAVLSNHYDEIKRVIEGLSDDAEIACVQYRDGTTLISSQEANRPCEPTNEQGLFAMTLGEEHDHDAHSGGEPVVQKKILEVAVRGEYSRRMGERMRIPFFVLGAEFLVGLFLIWFALAKRAS